MSPDIPPRTLRMCR